MKSTRHLLHAILLALPMFVGRLDAAIINVVETGGDNEPTDTILAKWSGVTYNRTIANEPTPGAVGTPYTVGLFMSGAPAFVDRNHIYISDPAGIPIPAYLQGQQYIMSGNDNRDNAGYILDVVIDVPSRVYMLIDNRLPDGVNTTPPSFGPAAMQWILDGGWIPTSNGSNRTANPALPDELPFDEGADGTINQYYSVYYHDFPAGSFQLFQADNAGRNMYGAVVVPIGEAPPVVLAATPALINEGQSANLDWSIPTDASAATIDQGIGDILPSTTNGLGSRMVTPAVTTTYALSVTSPGGNSNASATVTVRMVSSFAASDPLIAAGESVNLTWSTRSDATVTISGIGPVAAGNGSMAVSPTETTSYILTATSGAESDEATVTVFVLPPGPLFALLDLGATDGTPEAGALTGAQIGAAVMGTNGTNFPVTGFTSEAGDAFTLGIDNLDPSGAPVGGLDWRDRGDSSGEEWTFLGEDHFKNNAGMIRVSLGNLPSGTYDILSWHFDPTFDQCESIRILVTDADGTAVDTGVIGSAFANPTVTSLANSTANMVRFVRRFSVRSNGIDDVVIYFNGTAATDTEVPLNGLRISSSGPPVPPQIVDIRYDEGAGSITLEFTSKAGRFYSVHASNDLADFNEELDDSVTGLEGTTEFTEFGIDPSVVPQRYYRVMEQ